MITDRAKEVAELTGKANDETKTPRARIVAARRLLRETGHSVRAVRAAKRVAKMFMASEAVTAEDRKSALSLFEFTKDQRTLENENLEDPEAGVVNLPTFPSIPTPALVTPLLERPQFYCFCEHDIYGEYLSIVNQRLTALAEQLDLDWSDERYVFWMKCTGDKLLEDLLQELRDAEPDKRKARILFGEENLLEVAAPLPRKRSIPSPDKTAPEPLSMNTQFEEEK